MARTSEKGGSLHIGGAISLNTRKERMEKELGRSVAEEEMLKVTHITRSTNPEEEERLVEPRAQDTYREGRDGKREEEIAAKNKRYEALQAQLTFIFELGNILPPCPTNSDGSDQEGDETDKFDKESEGDKE
ncbi:hypothetical protein EJD97_005854 [Solanum chilense]|uniref:Uncharacterized protein n=1 Tax=Solanum chilense TaxID=4083 RepID=A0A6N2AL62_SOLCI|nr:hypothetical protein EJD97_005854 [Solanum chilense]